MDVGGEVITPSRADVNGPLLRKDLTPIGHGLFRLQINRCLWLHVITLVLFAISVITTRYTLSRILEKVKPGKASVRVSCATLMYTPPRFFGSYILVEDSNRNGPLWKKTTNYNSAPAFN